MVTRKTNKFYGYTNTNCRYRKTMIGLSTSYLEHAKEMQENFCFESTASPKKEVKFCKKSKLSIARTQDDSI